MRCPFCGQKRAASLRFGPSLHFECGTALCASHTMRNFQSKKCAQAEIENLNARIARLEEAGDMMAGRLSILAEFRRDETMVENWNISKTSLKETKP